MGILDTITDIPSSLSHAVSNIWNNPGDVARGFNIVRSTDYDQLGGADSGWARAMGPIVRSGQDFMNLGAGMVQAGSGMAHDPAWALHAGQGVVRHVRKNPTQIPRQIWADFKEHPEDLLLDVGLTLATGGGFAALKGSRFGARFGAEVVGEEAARAGERGAARSVIRTTRAADEAAIGARQMSAEAAGTAVGRRETAAVMGEAATQAAATPGLRPFERYLAARETVSPTTKLDTLMETGIRGPAQRVRQRLTGHTYSYGQRARMNLANRAVGGNYATAPRRYLASQIAGGRPIGGGSLWRARQLMSGGETFQHLREGGQIAANPAGYLMGKMDFDFDFDGGKVAEELAVSGAPVGAFRSTAGGWEGRMGGPTRAARRRPNREVGTSRTSNFHTEALTGSAMYSARRAG